MHWLDYLDLQPSMRVRMLFQRGLKPRVGDDAWISKKGYCLNYNPNNHGRIVPAMIKLGLKQPVLTWKIGTIVRTDTYYGDGYCTVLLV